MKTFSFFLCTLALASVSLAADKKNTPPPLLLSSLKFDRQGSGPDFKIQDAKGKAVLIVGMNVNAGTPQMGETLKSLPVIEEIAKREKGKLVVVGARMMWGTPEQIKEFATQFKTSFPIFSNVEPFDINNPPWGWLFDAKGGMVYQGAPTDQEFDRAVRRVTSKISAPSALDAFKQREVK